MKKIIYIFIIMMFHSVVYAALEIKYCSSGTTPIIACSNAGEKSQASPIIWDNFNNGSDGDLLTAHGWTKYATAADGGYLENDGAYGNSGLCAMNDILLNGGFNTSSKTYTDSDTIYVTWMQRIDFTGGTQTGSIKFLRINDDRDVYSTATNMNYQFDKDSPWLYCYIGFDGDGQAYPEETYRKDGNVDLQSGQWYRFEMYKKLSSPAGTENGVYWSAIDGVEQFSYNNVITKASGVTDTHSSVLLGLMGANLNFTTFQSRNDNLYIDNTLARVEIGDNSIFSNCTHKEIQIPSSWSDTSITITVNQGSFSDGELVYLFVIDSDGKASEGYPVIISGGQLSPPPIQANNLTANNVTFGG